MGRLRQLAVLQPCPVCLADRDKPCVNRRGGREIRGLHRGRTYRPRELQLNGDVNRIERDSEPTEWLWMFAHLLFGMKQQTYPKILPQAEWDAFYKHHPEYDPADQYHGEW